MSSSTSKVNCEDATTTNNFITKPTSTTQIRNYNENMKNRIKKATKEKKGINDDNNNEHNNNNNNDNEKNNNNNDGSRDDAKYPSSYSDACWNEMYKRLVEYKHKYGHCLVPKKYSGGGADNDTYSNNKQKSLGSWLNTQRVYKKKGRLLKTREDKLNKLGGFVWDPKQQQLNKTFHDMFNHLLQYKAEFGTCVVPFRYKCPKDGARLGQWIDRMRRKKRNGLITSTEQRYLDCIGVDGFCLFYYLQPIITLQEHKLSSYLLDLMEVLREQILGFLSTPYRTSSDLLVLSATCRLLLKDVESFSKQAMQCIAQNQNIDDDWLARVGLQATTNGFEKKTTAAGSSSYRRMLQIAYQTSIYSLSPNSGVLSLALNTDGTKLLSGGHGNKEEKTTLCLWDTSTKQLIQSFIGHDSFVSSCIFSGGKIISYSDGEGKLRIWNMDGACQFAINSDPYSSTSIMIDQEVFLFSDNSIKVIDINTGETTRTSTPRLSNHIILRPLRGNFFVEFTPTFVRYGPDGGDIRVTDSKSLEGISIIKGQYVYLNSSNNGDVVALTASERLMFFV